MKHQTDSLWTALNDYVLRKGQVSYGEMVQFTLDLGYKVSVMERRLRKSESPNIESIEVKSKRGTKYIGAYRWKGEGDGPVSGPTDDYGGCCVCGEESVVRCSCKTLYCNEHYKTTVMTGNCCRDNEREME